MELILPAISTDFGALVSLDISVGGIKRMHESENSDSDKEQAIKDADLEFSCS